MKASVPPALSAAEWAAVEEGTTPLRDGAYFVVSGSELNPFGPGAEDGIGVEGARVPPLVALLNWWLTDPRKITHQDVKLLRAAGEELSWDYLCEP